MGLFHTFKTFNYSAFHYREEVFWIKTLMHFFSSVANNIMHTNPTWGKIYKGMVWYWRRSKEFKQNHEYNLFTLFSREKNPFKRPCMFHCSWRVVAITLTFLTLVLSSVIVYFGGEQSQELFKNLANPPFMTFVSCPNVLNFCSDACVSAVRYQGPVPSPALPPLPNSVIDSSGLQAAPNCVPSTQGEQVGPRF